MSGITKDFASLEDFILKEQFLRKCHYELRMFLKERNPAKLADAVAQTERYLEAHGGPMFKTTSKITKPKSEVKHGGETPSSHVHQAAETKPEGRFTLTTP